MFWNNFVWWLDFCLYPWTLNMKCFEIKALNLLFTKINRWTLNMKCFEIKEIINKAKFEDPMNLKHEMFWNGVKTFPRATVKNEP